jgi:hypothetical protein
VRIIITRRGEENTATRVPSAAATYWCLTGATSLLVPISRLTFCLLTNLFAVGMFLQRMEHV